MTMKWHFLRGQVPQDRSPKEIMWNSLEECDDMWEHLFSSLVAEHDAGRVLYWGGHRRVYYRDNFCVEWVHSLKDARFEAPDVIIARGGFKGYRTYLEQFPNAIKVYYGANHGCIPRDGVKYDLVFVDCEKQRRLVTEYNYKAVVINKPAPPMFKPMDVRQKYDCCFVAVHPTDKRKNVQWVYKTCPRDLTIFQIGNYCKSPRNVTIKRVRHHKMPKAISRCKVLIAPYTDEDSGPRCITEAEACGIRPIILDSVKINSQGRVVSSKNEFWTMVKVAIDLNIPKESIRLWYEDNIQNHGLRDLILSLKEFKN